MDRRNFLSSSFAASALSLATRGDLFARANPTSNKSTPEYIDLRRYHLASGPGVKLTSDFFCRFPNSGAESTPHRTSWRVFCLLWTR